MVLQFCCFTAFIFFTDFVTGGISSVFTKQTQKKTREKRTDV